MASEKPFDVADEVRHKEVGEELRGQVTYRLARLRGEQRLVGRESLP